MKKMIKHKLYDTDTAKFIASVDDESLYQKKTGEFFLYSSDLYGNEEIVPYSFEQARWWADRNLSREFYDKMFGIPDSGTKDALHVYIDRSAIARAKQSAGKAGVSVSEYVENLISSERKDIVMSDYVYNNEGWAHEFGDVCYRFGITAAYDADEQRVELYNTYGKMELAFDFETQGNTYEDFVESLRASLLEYDPAVEAAEMGRTFKEVPNARVTFEEMFTWQKEMYGKFAEEVSIRCADLMDMPIRNDLDVQNPEQKLAYILKKEGFDLCLSANMVEKGDEYAAVYNAFIEDKETGVSCDFAIGDKLTFGELADGLRRYIAHEDVNNSRLESLSTILQVGFENDDRTIKGIMFEGLELPHREFTDYEYHDHARDIPLGADNEITFLREFGANELVAYLKAIDTELDLYIRCSATQFDLIAKATGIYDDYSEVREIPISEYERSFLKKSVDIALEKDREKPKSEKQQKPKQREMEM